MAEGPELLLGVRGRFDRGDVELPERGHHRSARPLDPSRITLCEEAVHRLGEDLPRHAEPVLEPAAGLLLTAVHKGVPVAIYLGLVLAEDLERDRLVRRELRPAVQGRELDAVDLEVDYHRRSGDQKSAE